MNGGGTGSVQALTVATEAFNDHVSNDNIAYFRTGTSPMIPWTAGAAIPINDSLSAVQFSLIGGNSGSMHAELLLTQILVYDQNQSPFTDFLYKDDSNQMYSQFAGGTFVETPEPSTWLVSVSVLVAITSRRLRRISSFTN